jgi:hypothetical protein
MEKGEGRGVVLLLDGRLPIVTPSLPKPTHQQVLAVLAVLAVLHLLPAVPAVLHLLLPRVRLSYRAA